MTDSSFHDRIFKVDTSKATVYFAQVFSAGGDFSLRKKEWIIGMSVFLVGSILCSSASYMIFYLQQAGSPEERLQFCFKIYDIKYARQVNQPNFYIKQWVLNAVPLMIRYLM